jgi:hypothetical protein
LPANRSRAGPVEQNCSQRDGDAASREVIVNALSIFGIDPLIGVSDRRAFINFSRGVFLRDLADLLPPGPVGRRAITRGSASSASQNRQATQPAIYASLPAPLYPRLAAGVKGARCPWWG